MHRALSISILATMSACTVTGPPPPVLDAGHFFPTDAGPPIDAPPIDAFHWPDTGPQPPPVLPQQSWTMTLVVSGDESTLTVNLDERAESGLVRVVAGANGRASNVVFDVLPGGTLRARGPIVVGLLASCGYDALAIEDFALSFADQDADGIHETLVDITSNGLVTRTGTAAPGGSRGFEPIAARGIARDVLPPVVSLGDPSFLPGLEPLELIASEPVAPSFMPRLAGPHTTVLVPDVGSSAPARWTIDTRLLTPGHYSVALAGIADLTGLAAVDPLPIELDVPEMLPPPIDDIGAGVVAVISRAPTTILGDDPGETALMGASSIVVRGTTAIVFDTPMGSHLLQGLIRVAGPTGTTYVSTMLSVYDERGVVIGTGGVTSYFPGGGTTPGFDVDEGIGQMFYLSYAAPRAGRVYAVLDLGAGRVSPMCAGGPPPETLGAALDAISVM